MVILANRAVSSLRLRGRRPLGLTTPKIPLRYFPKENDRLISFVIKLSESKNLAAQKSLLTDIKDVFNTKLADTYPEIIWGKQTIWKELEKWQAKGRYYRPRLFVRQSTARLRLISSTQEGNKIPLKLEPLFPNVLNEKGAANYELDKYFLVRLPIYEKQLANRVGKIEYSRVLRESAYILQTHLKLTFASPATNFPHYFFANEHTAKPSTLPKDYDWPRKVMEAQQINYSGDKVLIAHPDSGWTPHPLLNFTANNDSANLDLDNDWNVFNDQSTAEESLTSNAFNRYHGTATASLIISHSPKKIAGIAPKAKILPIRCLAESVVDTGVILIGDIDVARACWHAIQQRAHIISMSLGGYPAPYLEAVLTYAASQNIIPIAAAGNIWPFVIYPARYASVIAVGASNEENKPWQGSAKGKTVDFCAPGEQVYCADWDDSRPNRKPILGNGSGTSFSTAFTAGAAAIWLEKFGRNQLIANLPNNLRLVDVFNAHVKRTVTKPSGWDNSLYGEGVLNINKLINSNLPDLNSVTSKVDWQNWRERSPLSLLYDLFEHSDPVIVREKLALFLANNDPETVMTDFGYEVIELLMQTPQSIIEINNAIQAAQSEARDHIDNAIDAVMDFASDPLGSIAQWFD